MARRRTLYVSRRLKRQRWQKIKTVLSFGLGLIIGLAGYWLLVFSPLEQIQVITGLSSYDPIRIYLQQFLTANFQKWVFPYSQYLYPPARESRMSLLGISSSHLKQTILQHYPKLSGVIIKRDIWHHKLNIRYSLRKRKFIWCQEALQNRCFYVDKEGVAFGVNSLASTSTLGIILDTRTNPISLGQQVANPKQIQYLESIFQLAKQKDSPFTLKDLRVNKNFSYLHLDTSKGWYILFNPFTDFGSLQKMITRLAKERLSGKIDSLKYIDCRYLPKVYYQ